MSFLSRLFKRSKLEATKLVLQEFDDDYSDSITDEEIHASADWVIDSFLAAQSSNPAMTVIQFAKKFSTAKLANWKQREILNWLESQLLRSERVTLFDLACQVTFPMGVTDYDHDRILMRTEDRFLDRQDELSPEVSGAMTFDEMRDDIAACITKLEAEDDEDDESKS